MNLLESTLVDRDWEETGDHPLKTSLRPRELVGLQSRSNLNTDIIHIMLGIDEKYFQGLDSYTV